MAMRKCERCGGEVGRVYGDPSCLKCGHQPGNGLPAPMLEPEERDAVRQLDPPAVIRAQLAGWPVATLEDVRRLESGEPMGFDRLLRESEQAA